MYVTKKFRVKPVTEVTSEIDAIPDDYARQVRRIFLADGDAVIYPMAGLLEILEHLNRKFPALERISSYLGSQELVQKSADDWRKLADNKLRLLYFGLESGNDEVLQLMNKGHRIDEFKDTAIQISSFIDLSIMIILGGGGKRLSKAHALDTAKVVSEINPAYASLVTLFMRRKKNYFKNIETPTIGDLLNEARMIVANIEGDNIVFRSNHVSNFVSLSGTLPKDRERLVKQLDDGIARLKHQGTYDHYPDYYEEN